MTQAEHVRLQQLLLVPGVQVAEAGEGACEFSVKLMLAEARDASAIQKVDVELSKEASKAHLSKAIKMNNLLDIQENINEEN